MMMLLPLIFIFSIQLFTFIKLAQAWTIWLKQLGVGGVCISHLPFLGRLFADVIVGTPLSSLLRPVSEALGVLIVGQCQIRERWRRCGEACQVRSSFLIFYLVTSLSSYG